MSIAWGSLGLVALVSFAAAIVVTALVSFGIVGLAARAPRADGPEPALSPAVGTAVGAICLTVAVLIVLYGLYLIVA
ncbi:hypothetical protein [Actinomycetospora sp. NBRC 106378]|jgi:hypothetical protein|uniref:hypothetical protein n=1 Tax=unclassified Actinomycetospora TaxID=2636769 RepID=UPI0024A42591|nr:hypothetical protein [Actinomycetospora sp. NBRC 106378]GLZ51474.1 hypothetical protein Acsp07_10910 [Actinomycetospora sp. NBRC 106378]